MRWLTAAILLLLLAAASKTNADPDLWGHVRFGLDTMRTHTLPRVDPYSFTQDVPWINHEWLSELQMALAYHASGAAGLALLKGCLTLSALFLLWSSFKGVDLAVRMLMTGAVMLGCAWVVQNLRPQLWSLVLLALLCRLVTSNNWTARRWIPLLLLIWANLHGGWIVGLGIAGLWAFVEVVATRRHVVEWLLIVAASTVATLATPYGIDLWRFLWRTVHLTRDIDEWRPLWTWPVVNWLAWVGATALVVWLCVRPHRYRWQVLAVAVALAYASLRVSRLSALYVMAVAVMSAPIIRERWRAGATAPLTISRGGTAAAAAIMTATAVWIFSLTLRCISVHGYWTAPEDQIDLLDQMPEGRLVTAFDWGEYAIWHIGPRIRVSIDGRRETVYSDRRLGEDDSIVGGTDAGFAALAEWRAEYVWLPARSHTTKTWLAGHGYRIDVDTADAFVAVRADLPPLPAMNAARVHERCFPE